jgi:hypothetical protein
MWLSGTLWNAACARLPSSKGEPICGIWSQSAIDMVPIFNRGLLSRLPLGRPRVLSGGRSSVFQSLKVAPSHDLPLHMSRIALELTPYFLDKHMLAECKLANLCVSFNAKISCAWLAFRTTRSRLFPWHCCEPTHSDSRSFGVDESDWIELSEFIVTLLESLSFSHPQDRVWFP